MFLIEIIKISQYFKGFVVLLGTTCRIQVKKKKLSDIYNYCRNAILIIFKLN